MPVIFPATMPSAGQGFVQILIVFTAAALLVACVMLVRRYLVLLRGRSMQRWAVDLGWDYAAEIDPPEWLTALPLWSRVESPRIAHWCSSAGKPHRHVFDLEYLQMQHSGRDALGCTVVAIEHAHVDLPQLVLIPDRWSSLDGPEPIRHGMAADSDDPSGRSTGVRLNEATSFDDSATEERRAGMLKSRELADLPMPYLLTDSGDGRTARMVPHLVEPLKAAAGIEFVAAGHWLIGCVDRREAIASLNNLVECVQGVADAMRQALRR